MDKAGTWFRIFIGCVLPAFLLSCYLADILLTVDPAEKVLPVFQKDLVKLIVFSLVLGIGLDQIVKRFDLDLFRYFPLLGMAGYFILNGVMDAFDWMQAGKSFALIGPEIANNIIPSLFLGAGFGILFWMLAIQKSVQIAFMVSLIILGTSLFYIKEIIKIFIV